MFVNRYKASSWIKSLLKEGVFCSRFVWLYLRNGLRVRTVLFYPEFPVYKSELIKYLLRSRFNVSNNPKLPFELVVAWEDTTFRGEHPLLEALSRDYRVVNLGCTDISKRRVEELSLEVFGYGLFIDPTRHQGECVRKSNYNGRHDSTKLVQCPLASVDPDCVYQRLVDNRTDDSRIYDIRVQVCGNRLVTANLRYRSLASRFYKDSQETVHRAEDCLSPEEIEKVLVLADKIGMDYGEIDIVRDRVDARIHVVDVNNTPQQSDPGVDIARDDRQRYLRWGREAFVAEFLHTPITRRADAPARPRPKAP